MSASTLGEEVASTPEPRPARLNVAALRRAVMIRMWGGKGCGSPCDFCRVVVTSTDVEYEIDARLDGQIVMLHFHRRCYDAWKSGQEPAEPAPAESSPPSAA
ncbi:MAG TPA: hypothetical protein VFB37_14485 [Steroidobacteraceae bacterium]|nr:hypothetical protein [Steroidobacteraceae bacterium]